jgi:16S rRNA processing protein RimM
MAKADLPELDDEQYYWSDLEGLKVVDQQLGALGRVVGMFATAAHDILEVDSPAGEILIPAIEPFLVRVDRDAEQLHVNLPEGLVPEAEQ